MVSLTARRAATERLRAQARASLAATRPNLAVVPPAALPAPLPAGDKQGERYRWRCLIVHMFERSFLPDKPKALAARRFAYDRRGMIHSAFDAGRLKADVLAELGGLFDASGVVECG
jgi:hypothetical protein